jgi:FtsH-binding integral membrane protein
MNDATGSRPELQQVDQARHTASNRAKRAARHWMIACGVWCASATLLAGVLNRWVSNSWIWLVAYSVSLFMILKILRRLEDLAPVRARPSRRAVWVAAAVSIAASLAVAPFTNGGFGAYVASAAVVLGIWSALGWWTSR